MINVLLEERGRSNREGMAVVGNLHALALGNKAVYAMAMHQALDATASHLHPVCPQDGVHAGTSIPVAITVMHPRMSSSKARSSVARLLSGRLT